MNKIKKVLFRIICVFIHSFQFLQSAWYLCLGGIKKTRIFAGYFSYFFAVRYANKRASKWHASWDQSGRKQGVFAYTDTTFMVCSRFELKEYGKKIKFNKKIAPKKLFKTALYVTQPL
jgi:hypothetical protein